MVYDIVIIGSGTVGAFGGYYATKLNKKTLLIDKFIPPHTQGSYHGDTRIFRIAYGEGEKYIPLLQRAYNLWGDFEKDNNIKLFERCGLLNIGSRNSIFMQNILSSITNFKLEAIELHSRDIKERYGIHVPRDFFGILEPHTGFIYSDASIQTAIQSAKKFGAHTLYGDITQISKNASNGYMIMLADSEHQIHKITTQQILITAGSFTKEVLETFNFDVYSIAKNGIPVRAKRKVVSWFESESYKLESGFPAFILEFEDDHLYGFPNLGEGVKVGRDNTGQYIETREQRSEYGTFFEDKIEVEPIKNFFPHLNEIIKGNVCSYPMSPDEDPFIDFIADNILFMGGFSHGFKFAPALGLLGIESLISHTLPNDIQKHFSLKRLNQ